MAYEITAGEYTVKSNGEEIEGIESVEPNLDQETVEVDTMDGLRHTKTRVRSAEVVLTVVGNAIDNLKKILPNDWLAQATQIDGQPTGTVAKAGVGEKGVIVYGTPSCGVAELLAPLQIIPCDNPDEHTITLFDGKAELTNISFDDSVLKLEITVRSRASGVLLAKGAIDFPES